MSLHKDWIYRVSSANILLRKVKVRISGNDFLQCVQCVILKLISSQMSSHIDCTYKVSPAHILSCKVKERISGNKCPFAMFAMSLPDWFHLKCHFTKTALIFYHLHPFFQSKSKYGYHEMPLCNVCNVCLHNWFHLKCQFTKTAFILYHLHPIFYAKTK